MTNVNNPSLSAPSSLSLLTEVITSPSKALDRIWQFGASWWPPYLIVIVVTALVWVMYYSQVDYEWLLSYNTAELSGDEKAQAIAGMRMMPANILMGITVVSTVVILTAAYLVSALYLTIINRFSGTTERSFKQWLMITTWTALPAIFVALGSFLNLIISNTGEIAPEALSLTNLNNLVFQATKGDQLFSFYNSIDLISLWTVALLMMALYKNGQSKVASVIIALMPQFIISGISLFF